MQQDDKIKNAINAIADAIGQQDAPNAEIAAATLFLVEHVVTDINRIANALEKLSDCADGVHPSALRIIQQL